MGSALGSQRSSALGSQRSSAEGAQNPAVDQPAVNNLLGSVAGGGKQGRPFRGFAGSRGSSSGSMSDAVGKPFMDGGFNGPHSDGDYVTELDPGWNVPDRPGQLWRSEPHREAEQQAEPQPQPRSRSVANMVASGRITMSQGHRLNASDRMRRTSMDSARSVEALQRNSEYKSTTGMLTEALRANRKGAFTDAVIKDLGLLSLQRRVIAERHLRASPHFEQPFPRLAHIVESLSFDVLLGVIMITNGVMIGIQASLPQESEALYMQVAEHFCTAVFVVEVTLRMLVYGWVWICSIANALDVVLIFTTGVFPLWILLPAGVRLSNMSILQILRTLRLIRLIQTLRIRPLFRTPFKLVKGLMDSSRTIFNTYVASGISLFMSSVWGVYIIGRGSQFLPGSPYASEEGWPEACQLAQDTFYTVPRSTFTLFQVTTLDSWTSVARPLMKYSVGVPLIFMTVIMINALVLQNLITAVIVNNALSCLSEDHEIMAAELRDKTRGELQDLRAIFKSFDADFNDILTQDEFFEAVRSDESLRTKLQVLQIHPDETDLLWDLLCVDNETGIELETFVERMRTTTGAAKAKDSFALTHHVRRLNDRIECVREVVVEQKRKVDALREDLKTVASEFATMLLEAQDFIQYVGVCIPPTAAPRAHTQLSKAIVQVIH